MSAARTARAVGQIGSRVWEVLPHLPDASRGRRVVCLWALADGSLLVGTRRESKLRSDPVVSTYRGGVSVVRYRHARDRVDYQHVFRTHPTLARLRSGALWIHLQGVPLWDRI